MMIRAFAVVASVALCCGATAQEQKRDADTRTAVFRHHPGMIDTKERMAARDRDEELILKTVKSQIGSFDYSGNLGRNGYVLEIQITDLPRWKTAIENLHKMGALTYYVRWELDQSGFGLIPLPK